MAIKRSARLLRNIRPMKQIRDLSFRKKKILKKRKKSLKKYTCL